MRPTDSHAAVVYARCSTGDQALGIDAQLELVRGWAAREGLSIVHTELDRGISGASELEARPGLVAALTALRARGAGVLLIAKRDRLARDQFVALTIERAVSKLGARVVCADGVGNGEDPAAQLMRTLIDGMSQYERALIRARTAAALRVKAQRGEYSGGGAPFGWRLAVDGVHLLPVPEEQATVRLACELSARGMSLRAVARELCTAGHATRLGTPFRSEQIRRMLASPSRAPHVGDGGRAA